MTPDHMCIIHDGVTPDEIMVPSFLFDTTDSRPSDGIDRTEVYVPGKVNAPHHTSSGTPTDTFCILAGFDKHDKVGHSAMLYYMCSVCTRYLCHVCKKSILSNSLGPPCCQNSTLESIPYNGNLVLRQIVDDDY